MGSIMDGLALKAFNRNPQDLSIPGAPVRDLNHAARLAVDTWRNWREQKLTYREALGYLEMHAAAMDVLGAYLESPKALGRP